ncbi:AMP-binding protein [Minwuia thermotolerans]|uniref:3-methylmercaptopropionyl-CoA ligase n=1 Tax=Minwuia thermotolerans TaxID=2056226 RepID=A0A2M9FXK7_9PROT|nr:AMP-binding protein [Minwuia thermotolerans]PJK28198.1 AMP-binding protein [Minwuia thermotolerans]
MGEWFAKRRIGDLPKRAAALWGGRLALVHEGRRFTYGEFDREVDRVAKGLMGLGVQAGEKVAVWMTNCPEFMFLTYAVTKVGAVLVPLNTRYRTADLGYAVGQSDSVMMIAVERSGPVDYREMMAACLAGYSRDGDRISHPEYPKLRQTVMLGAPLEHGLGWDDLIAAGEAVSDEQLSARAAAVDPDAPWVIAYTSGTTGNPKGVLHNHICLRMIQERALLWSYAERDIHLCYLPLFHLYGLSEAALVAIMTGAAMVMTTAFDPDEAIGLVESERVTVLHGFDTHYADLLAAKKRTGADTSSLRLATFPSGVENSIPVARRTEKELCHVVSGYGMSETWAYITSSRLMDPMAMRTDASGVPMPDIQVDIVDPETGEPSAIDAPGEIRVRGYSVMMGYYNKPEATAESYDADGRFCTGDMALMRGDGYMRFMGRYKDMLKVGGENVSPAEVEAYLMELSGVEQAAVVGQPDPRLAEVPVAFIVPERGANLTETSVIEHCKGRIASYKIPRRVIFTDGLPMTPSGKIQKFKLRAQLDA